MAASILQQNKVIGGALHAGPRSFFVSWLPTRKGADKKGPPRCAQAFEVKLGPLGRDECGRPIERVVVGAPGLQQAGSVVAGGDTDWTDFVALLTSEYAIANRHASSGEFAQALEQVERAGPGAAAARAVWAAVIEPCDWRNFRIADRTLGELRHCHPLTPAKEIATTPPTTLDRDVHQAVKRLLAHDAQACASCTQG